MWRCRPSYVCAGLLKCYSYICTHVLNQQRRNFRQTYICKHWTHDRVEKNIILTWSAAYSNTQWTLNKHFMFTLQRNMCGGTAGESVGGGSAWDPWPGHDFKDTCGMRNDKGGMTPPAITFQQASHILRWSMHDVHGWWRSQPGWRWFVCHAAPPPSQISHRLPKSIGNNTGWVRGPPSPQASMPPPHAQILYFSGNISNKKPEGFGWLNGRVFLHTRLWRLLTHW
jgi:hypothetical protein